MRRPRPAPQVRSHALRGRAMRAVCGAVLVGYLAALSAATTGHGLRLALHLLTEHAGDHDAHGHDAHGHDASTTSPLLGDRVNPDRRDRVRGAGQQDRWRIARFGHESASDRDQADHHHEDHDDGADHDGADHDGADHDGADHDGEESHDAHETGHDPDAPHAHHGHVHTHHEEPPPPAWLSLALDKHVGPPAHRVPAPRLSRRADVLRPAAQPAAVVVAVEVPPPRREA